MKQTLLVCLLLAVFVRGYTRADGVKVRPHWRSSPDESKENNWGPAPKREWWFL